MATMIDTFPRIWNIALFPLGVLCIITYIQRLTVQATAGLIWTLATSQRIFRILQGYEVFQRRGLEDDRLFPCLQEWSAEAIAITLAEELGYFMLCLCHRTFSTPPPRMRPRSRRAMKGWYVFALVSGCISYTLQACWPLLSRLSHNSFAGELVERFKDTMELNDILTSSYLAANILWQAMVRTCSSVRHNGGSQTNPIAIFWNSMTEIVDEDFNETALELGGSVIMWLSTLGLHTTNDQRQTRVKHMIWERLSKSSCEQIETYAGDTCELRTIERGEICLLCYGEVEKGTIVPKFDCKHTLHNGCWLSILARGNGKCPQPGCGQTPPLALIVNLSTKQELKNARGR